MNSKKDKDKKPTKSTRYRMTEGKPKPEVPAVDPKYYIIYKPFGMVSQFTKEGDNATLADLKFVFPKDVYPVGRLDTDSEGLLLMTNDKSLNALLLTPQNAHKRTYWAQVEGKVSEEAMVQLQEGVTISVDGKSYETLPCKGRIFQEEPEVPPRNPPIRFRANIPTTWIELTLHEGKNRQVRKMCAQVGYPVLRLVRVRMGKLSVQDMKPYQVKEITREAAVR